MKYSFKEIEESLLEFWKDKEIYEKAKEQNKGKKAFYYLDGPPYTSGKVHLGTAWGKALRDSLMRYKRMKGTDVWDRAGFDMHGLPTENAVAKHLKLERKEDIEKYGIEKFQHACEQFCIANMQQMIADFKRLGVWMDFDNPYMSIHPSFIEAEWWLVKRVFEQDRLYEGKKSMHWCASCATALAKHELEYINVKDNSIFLKFQLSDANSKNDHTYLVIWTTTPWTIPFNLLVMVNPEIEYVKVKVDNEYWILAKALAGPFVQGVMGKQFEIEDEFKGSALKGMKYLHPLYQEIAYYKEIEKINPRVHTVVLSEEYVDTTAGSGLVHCAPGCGPEDFEIGRREELPAYNTLDEYGAFDTSMGKFKGWTAKKDDHKFIAELKKTGALLAVTEIEHEYAHCWRCKNPVVFRTTDQWFFKTEDLKDALIKQNRNITWIPHTAFNAFESWLRNLKDNCITRQRYWGTPVPVWKCNSCKDITVIGSLKELKEKTGSAPENLHKPWIDALTIPCHCGGIKKRVPDILDVWIDAGTTSWTCLDYPQKKELFQKLFPADFILEGKDQIRGWFNFLLVNSMLAFSKPSFKAVYMHGFIQDSQGRKMSKSLGNYISPYEVIDKYGADTLRYYTIGAASPGFDLNYNPEDVQLKHKNLLILWNLQNFVIELAKSVGMNPVLIKKVHLDVEEKYILSRLHSTIKLASEKFEAYALNEIPLLIEQFYMELSRTYIQLIREKAAYGTEKEKQTVLHTTFTSLLALLKLMAPITPFITEQIYQNMKRAFALHEESVHLCSWPESDDAFIDAALEKQMLTAQDIISNILFLREKNQLGVRWPVEEVTIDTKSEEVTAAVSALKPLIMNQVNTKTITMKHMETDVEVKPNYKTLGVAFGSKTPDVIDLITENDAKIVQALKTDKEEITLGKIKINKSHLEVKRKLPADLDAFEFKDGTIYLVTRLTSSLEAEGFSREIIRRIQQLRKNSGLVKQDKVEVALIADEQLAISLKEWKDAIQEKTGSTLLINEHLKKHEHHASEKIKGKKIELFMNKRS
ncbi:isoleucine--tRNA ligase [Candidatus Woesearchaeota archaeon]|nr:MAG: isoleucine--tRNA ligase [Candidatus Woesearchaeota archaeon]